ITCPACSATLNLKDELAGRAVKCPKCGGVIPASATQPPPAPAFEVVEDEPPAPPPAAEPKVPPRPVAAAEILDDEDEDDDLPVKPRPAKGREKPAGGKRNKLIVLGMVGYWVLAVAASAWLNYRGTNRINLPAVGLGSSGTPTTTRQPQAGAAQSLRTKYDVLTPRMSRFDLEEKLGPGAVMTEADYAADESTFSSQRKAWKEQIDRGRVYVWKSGTEKLYACVTADKARLQARRLHIPGAMPRADGEVDDEMFARENNEPLPAKLRDDPNWSGVKTHFATGLLKEFEENKTRALHRYGGLWMDVHGYLLDIEAEGATGLALVLKGSPESPKSVLRISIDPKVRGALEFSPGDPISIRAKCGTMEFGVLSFTGGLTPTSSGKRVASVQSTALGVLLSYGKDAKAADETYKGMPVRLNAGIVESREADGALIVAPDQAKSQLRVRVTFGPTWKDRFGQFKPGDKIHIRGVCQGLTGNRVTFEKAWPVPAP
ncbi:MAG TPA: hypothetical protein VMZ71_08355, partial [Gemmataceae bacterium]|nr:hypothetical protein [Gemmataceae bacterium]